MKVCIFLGPSVPIALARELLPEGIFLPPVQQGDVFTAVQVHTPSIIGIIDGYFQQRPSVWHKEILWALSQGVHVYGAASMGALRAAELEAFGMLGVGAIFEAFRRGALPPFEGLFDDDEVAVVHGPAETGFLAVSEALVNIRHTLAAAMAQQVIDEATHDELVKQARLMHFAERNHAGLLAQAHERGLSATMLERLENWLPTGRIDQKRRDAVLLLQQLAVLMQQEVDAKQVQFNFEETEIWRDAMADMQSQCEALRTPDVLQSAIIDELRLHESTYRKLKQSALLESMFDAEEQDGVYSGRVVAQSASELSLRDVADDYRRKNSLLDRESVDHWLKNNDMQANEFEDLMIHEIRYRSALNTPDTAAIVEALIAQLRLTGDYPAFASRAKEKLTVLDGITENVLAAPQLFRWYFAEKNGRNIPKNIEAYARSIGLSDEEQLIRLLSREHLFLAKKMVDTPRLSGDGL